MKQNKELVKYEEKGKRSTTATLWLLFFWIPIIPIAYMIFGRSKKRTYEIK